MNCNNQNNPHDRFFKELFSSIEVIESFIKQYLPQNILNKLNLATIEITKDTYVDKELKEHFSDILYRVQFYSRNSFLYLLFEHKSYLDRWTGFQLLRNMVKIWELYLKQNKRVRVLPVIIPIVIYHGMKPWSSEHQFTSLFEPETDTAQYIPYFKSEFLNLSTTPDDKIDGGLLLRVAFLAQKYIRHPDLYTKIDKIFELIEEVSPKAKAIEYVDVLLRYFDAAVSKNKEKLEQKVEQVLKNRGDVMLPILEKRFKDGKVKGRAEGRAEGREEEKKDVAEKMIKEGMDDSLISKITGLSMEQIEKIREKRVDS